MYQEILEQFVFTKKELIELLNDNNCNDEIFALADKTRKDFVGDDIHLRALIEFSNFCKNQCFYCGLRCNNKNVERYRLSVDEIIDSVDFAVEQGYKTVVLQSGEDAFFTRDIVCEIIEKIKSFDVALTLSIGERSYDDYKSFKDAGADRYLMRIETTDKNLYEKMHPNMDFEKRLECIKNIKKLGYETGTGCLVGLPGQTIESLADDILFFKEVGADMVGIGPFLPHPNTPLNNENSGDFWLALKVMALTRIMLKDVNIPATTAMETLHPDGRLIALQSGANVVMPNITLQQHRKKYEIYPNKAGSVESPHQNRRMIEEKIQKIGRKVSITKGFRDYQ